MAITAFNDSYELALPSGRMVLIDQCDQHWLSRFPWIDRQVSDGPSYVVCGGNGKILHMHRLVAGACGAELVDHINGDTFDNRSGNLRKCTHAQNMRNRKKGLGTSSRFKGVHLDKGMVNPRWRAKLTVDGRTLRLGSYPTEEEAATAYDKAAVRHHGEFARTNKALGLY